MSSVQKPGSDSSNVNPTAKPTIATGQLVRMPIVAIRHPGNGLPHRFHPYNRIILQRPLTKLPPNCGPIASTVQFAQQRFRVLSVTSTSTSLKGPIASTSSAITLTAPKPPAPTPPAPPPPPPPSTPENKDKDRKRLFSKELRCMMYGFGDDLNPYTETVDMIEDLVLKFINDIAIRALNFGSTDRISIEDLLFILRKDTKKYSRLKDLLNMNQELRQARKAFDEVKYLAGSEDA